MKKWKKIQKSLTKKFRKKLCSWFGHKPVMVFEQRWRGGNHYNFSHKGGRARKGAHYVTGHYDKCKRCGKKLSNFQRYW